MGTWTLFLGSFGYVLVLLGNFWFFWVLKGHILYKKMLNFNLTKAKNNKGRVGSSPQTLIFHLPHIIMHLNGKISLLFLPLYF